MSDFLDKDINELLGDTKKPGKPRETIPKDNLSDVDEQLKRMILADMEEMMRFETGPNGIVYPDSVKPLWKN